jgi:Complex I intermediate-associated protein 30 (CIA30)
VSESITPAPQRLDDFDAGLESMARRWSVFSDRVMGGMSNVSGVMATAYGRHALHLTGDVSLEQNGGFLQAACSLGNPPGSGVDARGFRGVALSVCGAAGSYFVHLRTADTKAPWQYYGAPLPVSGDWTHVMLDWAAFKPVSLAAPLDVSRLVRIGLVAAKTAFHADVALSELWLSAGD